MTRNFVAKSIQTALAGAVICLTLFPLSNAALGATNNVDCLMCHSAKTLHKTSGKASLYVNPEKFAGSVHGNLSCVECHADLKGQPLSHKTPVEPVDCSRCHEHTGWNPNTIHGNVPAEKAPKCQDCHGNHYVKAKTDPSSPVNSKNSPRTCVQCHSDSKTLKSYTHGVHSTIVGKGGQPAASCTDCHPSHTGFLSTSPQNCAKCHRKEFMDYVDSSHGKSFMAGNGDAPTCVDCHGQHDILPSSDPRSKVHPTSVPSQCSKCHDNPDIANAHEMPVNRLATYRESYHGVANKYGDASVASCASCHKAHNVHPSSDPRSSTSKQNLAKTCGKCHSGANDKVTIGKVHVTASHEEKNVLYWVGGGFKWLTIGTMTALIGHIMLDLFSRAREVWRRRRRDTD